MHSLIQDLLSYTQATTDSGSADEADAGAVMEQVRENLRTAIETSEAEISYDPLPRVGIREGQLLQLLQNIVSNALKYRGPEPPRVHVSAQKDAPRVAADREGQWPGYSCATPGAHLQSLQAAARPGDTGYRHRLGHLRTHRDTLRRPGYRSSRNPAKARRFTSPFHLPENGPNKALLGAERVHRIDCYRPVTGHQGCGSSDRSEQSRDADGGYRIPAGSLRRTGSLANAGPSPLRG